MLKLKKMIHLRNGVGLIIKLLSLAQEFPIVTAFKGNPGNIVEGFILYFVGVGSRGDGLKVNLLERSELYWCL